MNDQVHELAMSQLKLAQEGNRFAEEQLIILIRDKYMRRRIGRYLHKNRQCEDDDLIQEFLIGVSGGIKKARMDIGDPIEYIISQGVYKLRSYLRSCIISATSQVCMDCGYETKLNKIGNHYECKRCHSHNVITREINNHDETLFQTMESADSDIEDVLTSIIMQQFEDSLDVSTNTYNLYILMKNGINKDNPLIDNYIKTISQIWGGCSQQNVLQNINKLQAKLTKFAKEKGLEIKDNRFIVKGDE